MKNRAWVIVLGDFISFITAFILLILIRFKKADYLSAVNSHTVPFIILYISWVLIFYIFGLYDLLNIKPTIPYFNRWILALISSFTMGLLFFYFVPIFGISPKLNLVIQVVGFGFFSFLLRRMAYNLFARAITQPAILVGDSSYLAELEKTIASNPQIGLHAINHFKTIGEVNLNLKNIKNLVIILDKNIENQNQNILEFYKENIEIIDTAKAYEKYLYKIPVEYIDVSFIVENINTKKDVLYSFITFLLNIVFSITILILTLPFVIISAIFIYLYDYGPVFYTQKRVGINGKIFKLYKLRSMITDSEKDGAKWSTGTSDTRVTPVGKILRKLHIDELPQMINILKGDLSLVGPRPERPEFVNILGNDIPYYTLRHIIRPGFTGWAQIKYRYAGSTKDSKEKFEYDLYYIKNRNIFMDFGIIMRTIQIIFTH
ncbi:MAG: exopolysaccharide biosynthesis polyprenyl glycosylphosphotransferase [Candidatus Nomurabacteria bacterium]|nr:exopolysaccharide biosynthesis polyprenyl glycosylphosphotransferase [Candidatus Nomurabacteria bacterium]